MVIHCNGGVELLEAQGTQDRPHTEAAVGGGKTSSNRREGCFCYLLESRLR